MSERDDETTGRGRIARHAREHPTKTHAEIAADLDIAARSWVTEALAESPETEAIRSAYRDGIEIEDVDGEDVAHLAVALESIGIDGAVTHRLFETSDRDDESVDEVRIEIDLEKES